MSEPILLAVVEVARDDRVRCQAPGCNHPVFRRIHVVRTGDAVHVYGSDCFKRLFRATRVGKSTPRYTSSDGRRLTDEERQLLIENTAHLIERFENEWQADQLRHRRPPVRPPVPPPVSLGRRQAAEAKAIQILTDRPGIDAGLPGWRGLVAEEMRRILDEEG